MEISPLAFTAINSMSCTTQVKMLLPYFAIHLFLLNTHSLKQFLLEEWECKMCSFHFDRSIYPSLIYLYGRLKKHNEKGKKSKNRWGQKLKTYNPCACGSGDIFNSQNLNILLSEIRYAVSSIWTTHCKQIKPGPPP